MARRETLLVSQGTNRPVTSQSHHYLSRPPRADQYRVESRCQHYNVFMGCQHEARMTRLSDMEADALFETHRRIVTKSNAETEKGT